jgi:hypothetical protein
VYEATGAEQTVSIEPPLPDADIGSPMPRLVANDFEAAIAYWVAGGPPQRPPVAVVRFSPVSAAYFGSPNDEAFDGHALFKAGLEPYAFAEVRNSPWIAALERQNRVHPDHRPEQFESMRHFIMSFHDNTFECVAEKVSVELVSANDPASALVDVPLAGD